MLVVDPAVTPPPVAARLTLERLVVTGLRNIAQITLEPAPRVNVITGDNGQGKTSLLEAIYLVATTRSFRSARLADLVMHGAPQASVRARFAEGSRDGERLLAREQSVGLLGSRKTVRLDGQPPASLSDYATRSPVVVFEPQQLALSTGPAGDRRTLLDRVTLYGHPALASHRSRYSRALRERQRVLSDRYPAVDRVVELDVFEALLAEHGAAMTQARVNASEQLTRQLVSSFARIANPELTLSARYLPGGSVDPERARHTLRDARRDDARRKRTSFGPHRDDLELLIDGHPARVVGSQGQHRAITLALKIAELSCIAEARQLEPVLLLDDVSSELDATRTAALFEHLATTSSQIFLTTTRRELIITERLSDQRRDFVVGSGQLRCVSG